MRTHQEGQLVEDQPLSLEAPDPAGSLCAGTDRGGSSSPRSRFPPSSSSLSCCSCSSCMYRDGNNGCSCLHCTQAWAACEEGCGDLQAQETAAFCKRLLHVCKTLVFWGTRKVEVTLNTKLLRVVRLPYVWTKKK